MKTTLLHIVSLLSVIASISLIAAPVFACDCDVAKSAQEGLKQADAVFVGKVVDIGQQKFYAKVRADLGQGKSKMVTAGELFYKVKFAVSQTWKGAPRRTVFVLTHFSGSPACGYSFVKGKTYLVYANSERKPRSKGNYYLFTSICQRTEIVEKARKDLLELGQGKIAPS